MKDIKKVIYFSSGQHRKKQIYEWFNDVVIANNLTEFYNKSLILLSRGKDRESYKKFAELVEYIIKGNAQNENGDTLGYIISNNIAIYGYNAVIIDLYNAIIKPRSSRKRIEQPKRIVTGVTVDEIAEQVKKEIKTYYGYNTEGKRELAVKRVRITQTGKIVQFLQSRETGKILRETEVFKQDVRQEKDK